MTRTQPRADNPVYAGVSPGYGDPAQRESGDEVGDRGPVCPGQGL